MCSFHTAFFIFREHKAIVHETNPYIKFLKKPEHRAASWRPKYVFVVPPGSSVAAASHLLVDPKTNLSEKANAITNAVGIIGLRNGVMIASEI